MSIRTPELADIIVQGIADGTPLRELCRTHGIGKSAVYEWLNDDKIFAGRFAHARVEGYDAIADECLEIADDATNDWMTRRKGEEEVDAFDAEHVQRSKLRIETRLKLLAKWDPKRYGDRQHVEHSGEIGVADGLRGARERMAAEQSTSQKPEGSE